jgi:CrcB protein
MPQRWVVAFVFLGGCLGGAARHAAGASPTRTLLINLAGALLLGALVVAAPHHWRPLLGTGFCGAFTTFGTVMVITDHDLQHGRPLAAIGFLAASLLGGSLAAATGVGLGHLLHPAELSPEDPDTEVD